MGDIIRNQTPFIIVGEYLFNLIPYIVSAVTPLCSLLAVLITFGALNRSSELTAMKATGISLYRVVAPILVVAAMLAAALFAFDESYLPDANRRQEELRAEIKGKPAQTFLLAGRKWISGQTDKSGDPARIFYYQAFDPDDTTSSPTSRVFEFDPQTFTLQRRIFATSVRWDPSVNRWIFDNGWQRTFAGETIASYQPFTVSTFPEIHEQPGYFKKEDKPSDEMSYGELDQLHRRPPPVRLRHHQAPASSWRTSSPSPSSRWSWPSSPFPSPSPWANAAAWPASPPPSASPSPTGSSPASSAPWATSIRCRRCSPPGRRTCSSASPAPTCCCAPPPKHRLDRDLRNAVHAKSPTHLR